MLTQIEKESLGELLVVVHAHICMCAKIAKILFLVDHRVVKSVVVKSELQVRVVKPLSKIKHYPTAIEY